MSETSKAVFLSYASQDADAAKRIAEALRASGVEVWFDTDGGLEHGDEWDAKIRRQIKDCVLFLPLISANTQAREEGYFRIEWELAAQRALGIASGVAFILPVVIDDTKEPTALVPDRFRTVQWTKLPGGAVAPEVLQRFLKLWSHRTGALKHEADNRGQRSEDRDQAIPARTASKPGWKVYFGLAVAVFVIAAAVLILKPRRSPEEIAKLVADAQKLATKVTPPAPAAAQSEARQLAEKARAMFDSLDSTRDDYKLAEELIANAKAKDATDAEVCAVEAQLHERFLQRGWDNSDARREAARAAVQRALRLDPQSFEVRWAQAALLNYTGREGEERTRQLRGLRRERPTDHRILRALAVGLDRQGQLDEAVAILDESAALPGGDPLALYTKSQSYWFAGRTAEAEAAIEASIAQRSFTGALLMSVWYKTILHGDLDGARALLNRIAPADLIEDRAAYFAFIVEWLARRPDAAIARLAAVPRDWLNDSWYRGPKGLLVGDAQQLAGRPEAAAVERRAALKLVEARLATDPKNLKLLYNRFELLAKLGQRDEAERQFTVLAQLSGPDVASVTAASGMASVGCTLLGRKADAIRIIAAGLKRGTHAVEFTAADLRLNPEWDPLRGEPEFTAVIAEAEAIERAAGDSSSAKASAAAKAMADKSEDRSGLPAAPDQKSVAVLAFANLSDDKGNEYFSDGISEELLNVLAKIPGLKVSARTSAFYFKGKQVPMVEIAQQLGVAYVVEGSVRKAGDKVRITAQLIKATDGFQVWSDTFTRDLKDIFAVQDEIAGLIAQNLQLKLDARRAAPTISVKAYESYLQASDLLRQNLTRRGQERVQELLQAAVTEDPQFLQARIGLVDALSRGGGGYQGGTIGKGADAGAMLPAARRELADARRIAPNDPWVAYAEAIYYYQGEQIYPTALEHIARARALMPNEAEFLRLEARILRRLGRIDEAMPKWAEALKLDPLNVAIWRELSESHHLQRHFNEAAEATARLAVLEPDRNWDLGALGFRFLATAAPEAVENFERTWRRLPANATTWRGSDGQSWNPKLPQWQNDRAKLVREAGTLARPATNQTELPGPIGSAFGRDAGRTTWTMLALSGADEAPVAKTLAVAHIEAYGRLLDGVTVSGSDDQWLSMAATWYTLNGDEARARGLLAKLKEHDRLETDAYWRAYRMAWMLPAWSRLEPAEAAEKFLEELDRPMSYLSLDEVASSHWVFRPLLLDARIKARLVQQNKWLGYLADRVPEYAEFKAKK